MPTKTRKYDLHYRDLEGDIEAEVVIIGGAVSTRCWTCPSTMSVPATIKVVPPAHQLWEFSDVTICSGICTR